MADPATGLPADNIGGDLDPATRSATPRPTNIGAYLWSTVVARDTGLIGAREARRRMAHDARHRSADAGAPRASGMFYNWYDPATGAKLRDLARERQHRSSRSCPASTTAGWPPACCSSPAPTPSLADAGRPRSARPMDFGYYYNAAENAPGGQIRGGFWVEDPHEAAAGQGQLPRPWHRTSGTPATTTAPSTPSPGWRRYLGIAAGQIPREHYFGTYRTFPNDNCDWSWTETKPVGDVDRATSASASSRARCPTAA